MERNKTIMKLCYLQTALYIVFLTALIRHHRQGMNEWKNRAAGDFPSVEKDK